MLLIPKRLSSNGSQKRAKLGRVKAYSQPVLRYGDYGLYSMSYGLITARQIEAARRVMRFRMARQGKLWIPVFPHRPFTAKPAEVRMGGGSGSIKYWGQIVKPGMMRFELRGVTPGVSKLACYAASKKLGFRTGVVVRSSLYRT